LLEVGVQLCVGWDLHRLRHELTSRSLKLLHLLAGLKQCREQRVVGVHVCHALAQRRKPRQARALELVLACCARIKEGLQLLRLLERLEPGVNQAKDAPVSNIRFDGPSLNQVTVQRLQL